MMTKERQHKKVKLQYNSNRYVVTVPGWGVRKVLQANKGDTLEWDFIGGSLTLTKLEDKK